MPDRPGHPPATTIQNATAVVITRRADAERLIADLRSALRRSGRTGGRYAAFAHDAAGAATITLAIHLDGTDRRPRRRPPLWIDPERKPDPTERTEKWNSPPG